MAVEDINRKPLKRLGLVHRYGAVVSSYGVAGGKVYSAVRARTPTFAEPYVAGAEEAISARAAPLLTYSSDTADKLLHIADDKLDAGIITTSSLVSKAHSNVHAAVSKVHSVHTANLETAQSAASKYYELVSSTGAWVAEKLSPQKNVQFAKELLNSALERAKQATDPDVAAKMVEDAWASFASVPAVASLLKTLEPATRKGYQIFVSAHDQLVSHSLYKKAVTAGGDAAGFAAGTTPYKLSAKYAYPIVAPVADPVLEKLNKSEVVAATVAYWSPATPPTRILKTE